MKIGIDARLYGPEHTGLGRYITNLVDNLIKTDKRNTYVLFVNQKHLASFKQSTRLKVVSTNIPIYSFSEQLVLPFIFYKEKLDLLHSPHFNTPFLYFKKTVITIHDLIKHKSKGMETTTRNPLYYLFLRWGYHFLTYVVAKKAKKIIVPSYYVKDQLQETLKVNSDKIIVTYESTSNSIKRTKLNPKESRKVLAEFNLTQPFIIYTGNIYPHKNINILVDAVIEHNKVKEVDLMLAIVCARSTFEKRLVNKVKLLKAEEQVKFLGYVDDVNLGKLYSLALCLIHPSKMEGFGLTGLEAMAVGLPVISSNSSCLPEVYGDACLYFDPDSTSDLVSKMEQIIKNSDLRDNLAKKGLMQAKKYSWKRMTKETIEVYASLLKK